MRRIAIFEDAEAEQFRPIALLRPVFELLCGHFSVRERLLALLAVAEWGAFVRPFLAETYREQHPAARVNDDLWLQQGPTLLINGRWLPDAAAIDRLRRLDAPEAGLLDGTVAYLALDADEALALVPGHWDEALTRLAAARHCVAVGGNLLHYPWDLIHHNPAQLSVDFQLRPRPAAHRDPGPQVALQGPASDIFIDPAANVDPFVVIDARHGPVWIEAGAKIQPFTRLEGPCYVGRDTQLFRANVREGTSLGPVCRAGGEIEDSILHGYCNKYHDGFLGHSYVCPWVNLGALTTNSDLKNDYSAVRVPLAGAAIDTGSTKVGCFIGDHSKTALCSLFNTGSSIGVMSMLLPAGELLPKHVPSFTRLWHGRIEDLGREGLEAGLRSARIAMGRRHCELTPAAERLLRRAYSETQPERSAAEERTRIRPSR